MLLTVMLVSALPPNYDDIDLAVDQAVGEKVDIDQAEPNSNTIHISHNNPKDSDIKVVQTDPFNTTVHISLNVGTGSKVSVSMTNARNLQLHISFNGMGNSECMLDIQGAFNSTVHASFQNPRNTPVTVVMNDAKVSQLHVSQNIPQKSPMKVTMDNAENCQIHLSQSVPMFSPLTWNLNGDPEVNQIEVSQNAADDNSELDCNPECPQEEYVYDYSYADSHKSDDNAAVSVAQEEEPRHASVSSQAVQTVEYDDYVVEDNDYTYEQEKESISPPDDYTVEDDNQNINDKDPAVSSDVTCPGGDLQTCVDICPGQYGPRVFGACVTSCATRCP